MPKKKKTLDQKILTAYEKGYDVKQIGKKVGASSSYVWDVVSKRHDKRCKKYATKKEMTDIMYKYYGGKVSKKEIREALDIWKLKMCLKK